MIGRRLRRLAERASRHVVLRRRLPAEAGGAVVYVTPDSALRLWSRRLASADPRLVEAAIQLVRPGHVVWDVGANVGLFAFAAAGLAGREGRVLAIEPDGVLAGLLRRSARALAPGHARVEVLPVAASDRSGAAVLCVAARGRSSNHLKGAGLSQTGGVREEEWVGTVMLDALLERFSPPHVLKIDVEGHETAVLAGARALLDLHRPTVLCEVDVQHAEEVTAALRRHRYVLFDADSKLTPRPQIATACWNTLALPLPS